MSYDHEQNIAKNAAANQQRSGPIPRAGLVGGSNLVEPPSPKAPIEASLNELHCNIDELHTCLTRLADRLTVVSSPRPESGVEKNPEGHYGNSPMGRMIDAAAHRVCNLRSFTQTITELLEI